MTANYLLNTLLTRYYNSAQFFTNTVDKLFTSIRQMIEYYAQLMKKADFFIFRLFHLKKRIVVCFELSKDKYKARLSLKYCVVISLNRMLDEEEIREQQNALSFNIYLNA